MADEIKDMLDKIGNLENYKTMIDEIHRSVASGGCFNQFQTFFTGFDKFNRSTLPPNAVHSGMTFITRPKLNLTSSSLRQSSKMIALDTLNVTDVQHMIRCILDTKFAKSPISNACKSALLNISNPFNVPLTNALVSISGFPDIIIESNTTEGGFHGENQTFAIGGDNLNKTYDLTLTFKDPQGGVIAAMIDFWLEYIRCVSRGIMIAYKEDIDALRLNYTVSIYRFLLDPTRKFIVGYAKATGTYPSSIPIGGMFNVNEGEVTISTVGKFSVPWKVNKIEYNKPEVIADFNRLVRKFCGGIDDYEAVPNTAYNNYIGLPYVYTSGVSRGMQLQYRVKK